MSSFARKLELFQVPGHPNLGVRPAACYEARVSRVAISVLALCPILCLAACGGSSSETPFPLEPDLSRLDGGPSGQSRYIVYTGEKQKPEPGAEREAPPEASEEPDKPAPPAK